MIRPVLKTAGAHLLRASGTGRFLGALNGNQRAPLVLCYHRVVEDARAHPDSAPAMLVSTATLERQLDWVGRRYEILGLEELVRGLESGHAFPRPVAAVTFDDGYADVYEHGFPLLRRKGVPFAVFVVSGLVGTDRLQTHDELFVRLRRAREFRGPEWLARRLEEPEASVSRRLVTVKERLLESRSREEIRRLIESLEEDSQIPGALRRELRPMTWPMLRELRDAGVTVGSHTRTHVTLPSEEPQTVREELEESRYDLEEGLGSEVVHLAYPGGRFSPDTLEAARRAGYRYAYTTCSHRFPSHPLLTISRRTFWERSAAGLVGNFSSAVASCQVQGIFDRFRDCPDGHREPAAAREEAPAVTRRALT